MSENRKEKVNKPSLKLFRTNEHKYSVDCIDEFYTFISNNNNYNTTIKTVELLHLKSYIIGLFKRIVQHFQPKLMIPLTENINFSAQLGPDLKMCLPDFFYTNSNFIYMFDAWPRFHKELGKLFDLMNVKAVFFSSRDVVSKYHANISSNCKAYWIPEGINATEYSFKEYKEKTIDVLEFGRMYKCYHDKIVKPLSDVKKKHLFPKTDQPILFETKAAFKNALADTKISICVPSSITHPERAEDISTMTLRYLQCMASKCLIIGIMPDEMKCLFDYLPMIEIDMINPEAQLLNILNNYEYYHPLIDKNYKMVNENHQWKNRWKEIEEIIKKS
ncbi:hypothetical protein ACEN2P_17530 [Pedobacter psychrotolerans]|uniref:hypothetical protein n=1 Tax=Pedobacter psychrotolerans TaxID=1843235 RepID=UPI003F995AE9